MGRFAQPLACGGWLVCGLFLWRLVGGHPLAGLEQEQGRAVIRWQTCSSKLGGRLAVCACGGAVICGAVDRGQKCSSTGEAVLTGAGHNPPPNRPQGGGSARQCGGGLERDREASVFLSRIVPFDFQKLTF